MFKRIISVCISVLMIFSFCGCSSNLGASTHEKIQKKLVEMKSYECSAKVTRISNKGENTYGVKQWYQTTGEYKMEMTSPENVVGNYTVFDGKKVCQYNPKMNSAVAVEVDANQARNELFLGQFIKNYLQSEEVAIAVDNLEEGRCTVLEAIIPGNYKYSATEKLWVDNETLLPTKFVIYDVDGKERYIINYENFTYDVDIDPNVFKIPQ